MVTSASTAYQTELQLQPFKIINKMLKYISQHKWSQLRIAMHNTIPTTESYTKDMTLHPLLFSKKT